MMMMLVIGTHSVTTTLNVHSRSRSFVSAIDLRGLSLECSDQLLRDEGNVTREVGNGCVCL